MSKSIALQKRGEVAGADVEIISTQVIGSMIKAETDSQIATAKAYPRSINQFLEDAKQMACTDEKIASECIYALERKEDGGGKKVIRGPSIRLAEICASAYGNLRIGARIVGDDGAAIVAQGVAHDLERNIGYTVETRRRIVKRDGSRYSEDMIITTGNAGVSIAVRNAIFRVIPKPFINSIQERVEEFLAERQGSGKKLLENAKKAIKWFIEKGATEAQVLKKIGRDSIEKVTASDIVTLRGFVTAIEKDHTTTMADLFPAEAPIAQSRLAKAAEVEEESEDEEQEEVYGE